MDLTAALNRRAFLKLGASAAAASLAGCSLPGDRTAHEAAAKAGPVPLSGTEAFNYIVGTQTIGATYQFTQESVLVETAQAILDLGSNLLKFTLGRGYTHLTDASNGRVVLPLLLWRRGLGRGGPFPHSPRWMARALGQALSFLRGRLRSTP